MKRAPVKTDRNNGSFSIISLTECQEALEKLFLFFLGHFLRQWNLSLWRLLCSLVHSKTQHLKSFFGADIVYLQQLQQVISKKAEVDCSFSLRAVFMLTGQRHKWAGLFPLCDVNRGRIWNSSFWETVYDFFYIINQWLGVFLPLQARCFHTLRPHNCVQTPYKSDFCIIGPL